MRLASYPLSRISHESLGGILLSKTSASSWKQGHSRHIWPSTGWDPWQGCFKEIQEWEAQIWKQMFLQMKPECRVKSSNWNPETVFGCVYIYRPSPQNTESRFEGKFKICPWKLGILPSLPNKSIMLKVDIAVFLCFWTHWKTSKNERLT